jgi:hypothetical protein
LEDGGAGPGSAFLELALEAGFFAGALGAGLAPEGADFCRMFMLRDYDVIEDGTGSRRVTEEKEEMCWQSSTVRRDLESDDIRIN